MTIESFAKNAADTIKDNSPSILAALAVGGVATTGLFAYRFGVLYGSDMERLSQVREEPLSGKEKFERYWRPIVPVLLVGSGTIACIVASTAINNRRNAALAGLVTLGEVTLREYKEKVREVVTKPKSEEINRSLAQDQLDKSDSNEVIFVGDGDILVFDTLTGRKFKSSKLAIERAEVEIGRRLLHSDYVSQNEWYDEIGIPRVSTGDDHGWNHDIPLEVQFVPLIKDDVPVLGLDYRFRPVTHFDRMH